MAGHLALQGFLQIVGYMVPLWELLSDKGLTLYQRRSQQRGEMEPTAAVIRRELRSSSATGCSQRRDDAAGLGRPSAGHGNPLNQQPDALPILRTWKARGRALRGRSRGPVTRHPRADLGMCAPEPLTLGSVGLVRWFLRENVFTSGEGRVQFHFKANLLPIPFNSFMPKDSQQGRRLWKFGVTSPARRKERGRVL